MIMSEYQKMIEGKIYDSSNPYLLETRKKAHKLCLEYNSLLERIEYYDAYGSLLKTEKYNELLDRKEVRDQYGNPKGYEKRKRVIMK